MARAFVFRLEALLKLRRMEEAARQRGVAEALSVVQEQRNLLVRLSQRAEVETRRLRQAMRGATLPVDEVMATRGWIGRLVREGTFVARELVRAEEALTAQRAELARAVARRKALERLREKRLAEHMQRLSRAEDALLDEIAARSGGSAEEVAP